MFSWMLNYGLIWLVIYQNEHCLHWLSACLYYFLLIFNFFLSPVHTNTHIHNHATENKQTNKQINVYVLMGMKKNRYWTCKSQLKTIFHTKRIIRNGSTVIMAGFIELQSIITIIAHSFSGSFNQCTLHIYWSVYALFYNI